jgi:Cysteine-rich CPCC
VTLEVTGGTAEHEICKVCFWQHDHVDEAEPDRPPLGPNRVALSEARENFAAFGACERKHVRHVRPPRQDEIPA